MVTSSVVTIIGGGITRDVGTRGQAAIRIQAGVLHVDPGFGCLAVELVVGGVGGAVFAINSSGRGDNRPLRISVFDFLGQITHTVVGHRVQVSRRIQLECAMTHLVIGIGGVEPCVGVGISQC